MGSGAGFGVVVAQSALLQAPLGALQARRFEAVLVHELGQLEQVARLGVGLGLGLGVRAGVGVGVGATT